MVATNYGAIGDYSVDSWQPRFLTSGGINGIFCVNHFTTCEIGEVIRFTPKKGRR